MSKFINVEPSNKSNPEDKPQYCLLCIGSSDMLLTKDLNNIVSFKCKRCDKMSNNSGWLGL